MSTNPPRAKPHDHECQLCWRTSYRLEGLMLFQLLVADVDEPPTTHSPPTYPHLATPPQPPQQPSDEHEFVRACVAESMCWTGCRSLHRASAICSPAACFEHEISNFDIYGRGPSDAGVLQKRMCLASQSACSNALLSVRRKFGACLLVSVSFLGVFVAGSVFFSPVCSIWPEARTSLNGARMVFDQAASTLFGQKTTHFSEHPPCGSSQDKSQATFQEERREGLA